MHMRGPLGHGFALPASTRRMALTAYRSLPGILLSLLHTAVGRQAAVTLLCDDVPDDLPLHVEAQPLSALPDAWKWADFIALDIGRDLLPEFRERVREQRVATSSSGQALVRAPMACGGMAACGVCTVELRGKGLLACEDGPVFELAQLLK